MQITITNDDIDLAVRNYIAQEIGVSLPINDISFTTTRNPPGISAEIQLGRLQPANVINTAPIAVFVEQAGVAVEGVVLPSDEEEEEVTSVASKGSLFS